MGFLEDLKNGDIKSIILVIFGVLFFNLYWCAFSNARSTRQSRCRCKDNKELMSNVSNDIKEAVKQVYLADVEAIRNLSEVATKINAGTFVFPGNLNVTGSFNYLPKGTIVAYNQTSAPSGWTLCDGQNGAPDLRGKFIFGNGGSRGMNSTGGAETVALGVHQMPQHNHNVNGSTSENGLRKYEGGGSSGWNAGYHHRISLGGNNAWNIHTAENHSHNFNVDSGHTGGSQAHENMPPFYVLTYIMKL